VWLPLAMVGLRALHEAIVVNEVLTDWVIPMHDIEKVFKKSNVKDVRELRAFVRDFELQMDNNEHKKSPDVCGSPLPCPFPFSVNALHRSHLVLLVLCVCR
jgi:hypothetical protein